MEDKNFPFISIIISCRDEKKYISRCLDSIIAQDYPKDKPEVLVIDRISNKTKENVATASKINPKFSGGSNV